MKNNNPSPYEFKNRTKHSTKPQDNCKMYFGDVIEEQQTKEAEYDLDIDYETLVRKKPSDQSIYQERYSKKEFEPDAETLTGKSVSNENIYKLSGQEPTKTPGPVNSGQGTIKKRSKMGKSVHKSPSIKLLSKLKNSDKTAAAAGSASDSGSSTISGSRSFKKGRRSIFKQFTIGSASPVKQKTPKRVTEKMPLSEFCETVVFEFEENNGRKVSNFLGFS